MPVLAAPGARHDEILTPAARDFGGRLTATFTGPRQGTAPGTEDRSGEIRRPA
ncbi:hypothetical protein M2168_000298 [Streptomyces sp. CZ24]|nr:hypothetical protein [Streptomyces sp. CZ24]